MDADIQLKVTEKRGEFTDKIVDLTDKSRATDIQLKVTEKKGKFTDISEKLINQSVVMLSKS